MPFFCSRVFKDKSSMVERALEVAKDIASKSPIAVQTTKMQLNYARDHSVDEGLDYIVRPFNFFPILFPLVLIVAKSLHFSIRDG